MKSSSHGGCLPPPLCAPECKIPRLLCSWILDRPSLPHDWTNGVFVPTFMEVLGPWVRVWLVLKEEWTWSEVWAQRGFREPGASWTEFSDGGRGKVFCAATQGSEGALASCAFMGPQFRVESFQGTSRLWEEGCLPPSITVSKRGRGDREQVSSGATTACLGFWTALHFGLCCILSLPFDLWR